MKLTNGGGLRDYAKERTAAEWFFSLNRPHGTQHFGSFITRDWECVRWLRHRLGASRMLIRKGRENVCVCAQLVHLRIYSVALS